MFFCIVLWCRSEPHTIRYLKDECTNKSLQSRATDTCVFSINWIVFSIIRSLFYPRKLQEVKISFLVNFDIILSFDTRRLRANDQFFLPILLVSFLFNSDTARTRSSSAVLQADSCYVCAFRIHLRNNNERSVELKSHGAQRNLNRRLRTTPFFFHCGIEKKDVCLRFQLRRELNI